MLMMYDQPRPFYDDRFFHAVEPNASNLLCIQIIVRNPNSQSSLLQLRARDIWQKGCAPLNPAKA